MDYENVAPVQDIGAWYNLFNGNNTADEPKEVKPAVTNALGELLIYSAKARAYAEFIIGATSSIESDIKRDIATDISPVVDPYATQAIPTSVVTPQPLAMAVANRDKLVEYSEKLSETVKAIDSILARVKIKEQQQ